MLKKHKGSLRRVISLALLALTLIFAVGLIGCSDSENTNYPILKWSSDGLYGILPPPQVEYGSIITATDSTLEFVMNGIDKKAFSIYIQLCAEKGFTHEVVNTNEFFYSAKNEIGYKITLQYTQKTKELSVILDATNVLISVGRPSDDFIGLMYTDAVDMMKTLGFINVQTQEVSVSASSTQTEYSVESVTAGGSRFTADQKLSSSTPIVVRYYRKNVELRTASVELKDKNYEEVEAILRREGFSNIILQENLAPANSTLPDTMDGKTVSVSINGQTSFMVGDQFPPSALITVTYHNLDVIMDQASDSLMGQPKDQIASKLKEMGFKDVRLLPTPEGGDTHSYQYDDTVAGIRIGETESFNSGARLKRYETVYITYYEFDITVTKSAKTIKSEMMYYDAEEYLRSLGFVNIKIDASHELINGWINKPDEIKSITVNGNSKFDENTTFHHDHEIVIVYYAY